MASKRQSVDASADVSAIALPLPAWPIQALRAWTNFLKAYKVVVEKVDKETLAGGNISLAEYELMLYVRLAGGRIRFIDLSKVTLLSQSQISRRIDALQTKGFLFRESTNTDRRATFAVMTPAGEQALALSQPQFFKAFEDNFVNLIPADKLAQFADLLEVLIQDPGYISQTEAILKQAKAVNEQRST